MPDRVILFGREIADSGFGDSTVNSNPVLEEPQ